MQQDLLIGLLGELQGIGAQSGGAYLVDAQRALIGMSAVILIPVAVLVVWGAVERWKCSKDAARLVDQGERSLAPLTVLREGMMASVFPRALPCPSPAFGEIQFIARKYLSFKLPALGPEFRTGEPAKVMIQDASGAISFTATVLDWDVNPAECRLRVQAPSWVERVQRREYVRVPINEPTRVVSYDPTGNARPICAAMIDLSATGCRVATHHHLHEGAVIRVQLPEDLINGAYMDARVLRVSARQCRDGMERLAQCQFLGVNEEITKTLLLALWDRERVFLGYDPEELIKGSSAEERHGRHEA